MFEVYCLTSPSNRRYIGYSARGMAHRWRRHVATAHCGSWYPIHCAIRKYGAESFRHELLEQCDTQAGAHAAERRWIAWRGTQLPVGYNATAGGEGQLGRVISEDTRAKMSAWPRKPISAETRARLSASGKGRKLPPRSAEHRAKLAAAGTGRAVSDETRARRSAALKGKTLPARTEEQRARYRVAATGIRPSEDVRAKMRKSHLKAWTMQGPLAPVPFRIAPVWRKLCP